MVTSNEMKLVSAVAVLCEAKKMIENAIGTLDEVDVSRFGDDENSLALACDIVATGKKSVKFSDAVCSLCRTVLALPNEVRTNEN